MNKLKPLNRSGYTYFKSITTRWIDNDVFGHINNVNYYSYFDTTVNHYLIEAAGFEIHADAIIGFVVHSECDYFKPIAFPDAIEIGLRLIKIGNSSVTYGLAVFKKGEKKPSAQGSFVHVFVNRKDQKSVVIPDVIGASLELLK